MSSGKTSLVPFGGLRSSVSAASSPLAVASALLSSSWRTAALALPPPLPEAPLSFDATRVRDLRLIAIDDAAEDVERERRWHVYRETVGRASLPTDDVPAGTKPRTEGTKLPDATDKRT